ncbi:MAG: efflux transporter outer membrane subunit [Mangrovibacterium sp.]
MGTKINRILIVLLFFTAARPSGAQEPVTHRPAESRLISNTEKKLTYGSDTLRPLPAARAEGNQWWLIFGYEQLNGLVARALDQNHQLLAGKSQVAEAKAREKLAKSALYPTLGINPKVTREELSANRPLPFDVPAERVRYSTYMLPLELSYELDLFGKNTSERRAGSYRYQSSQAFQEASALEIEAEVARNYILLLMLDSDAEVLKRTRNARLENLNIVTTRYNAGLTNEIDVQRARTELSSVDIQIRNTQIDRREAELQLAALTGQPADSFRLESSGIQYHSPEVWAPGTDAMPDRPDLKAGRLSVEAFAEQIKNARRNRYPSLSVFGSAGLVSATSNKLFEEDSRNWLVGANLSIPVFEGRRRQSLLEISEQQMESAAEQLKQNELIASRQVAQASDELRRLNEKLSDQQQFLNAALKTADLSRQRYKQGLVTYLEVVDAERVVLEAERLLIQILGGQLLSTVDLFVSLGGNTAQVYKL